MICQRRELVERGGKRALCDAAPLCDEARELLEIIEASLDEGGMAPNRSVGGFQVEHRLAGVLSHGHQAAVVAKPREAVGIRCRDLPALGLVEHLGMVDRWDSLDPLGELLDRAIESSRRAAGSHTRSE